MIYGLTSAGYVSKPRDAFLEEMRAAFLEAFGIDVDLDPSSPHGQLMGIMADRLYDSDQALATVWSQLDPRSARGFALDMLSSWVGVNRDLGQRTVVRSVAVTFGAGSALPATIYARTPSGDRFSASTATVSASVAAGAATSSPEYLDFTAEESGPIVVGAGDLSVPESARMLTVSNATAGTPGTLPDSDSTLRAKREQRLGSSAQNSLLALPAKIRALPQASVDIRDIRIFENTSASAVDFAGLSVPAKSFETVILGSIDTTISGRATISSSGILRAIFQGKPGGIKAYGRDHTALLNSSTYYGASREVRADSTATVGFSTADVKTIGVSLELSVDSTYDTSHAGVIAAIASYSSSLTLGRDVYASRVNAAVQAVQGVQGVLYSELFDDTPAAPAQHKAISEREVGVLTIDPLDIETSVEA